MITMINLHQIRNMVDDVLEADPSLEWVEKAEADLFDAIEAHNADECLRLHQIIFAAHEIATADPIFH